MPPDSFMARGTQGQYIVIVPSARLVVVRLGMAHDRYEDIDGVARLLADAIAARLMRPVFVGHRIGSLSRAPPAQAAGAMHRFCCAPR